jgi:predicted N-formylglutamate amidohydrolase
LILVLTCEHAGNEIPLEFRHLFSKETGVLDSHRGYDPGAFDLFTHLKELSDFSHFQSTGRLLVEVNRSSHHPNLFSEFSKILSLESKKQILEQYYFPYRKEVERNIAKLLKKGEKVLHVSVHSFTPALNGVVRNADIGLLYDPSRQEELRISADLKQQLRKIDPQLKVRFNYPYLGKADGFTTYLRKKFPKNYSGIELEVNQKFVAGNKMEISVKNDIFQVLSRVLKE